MARAAKARTAFVCDDCGAEHGKWQGQCVSCGAWNTLKAFRVAAAGNRNATAAAVGGFAGVAPEISRLADIGVEDMPRLRSGIGELDRVLGGGFVPGSAVLIGGDPGAGKSTLLLEVATRLAGAASVLYVTGEESLSQVALRARRLELPLDALEVAAETRIESVERLVETRRPALLVVDSIQVMVCEGIDGVPGGVTQVREAAAALTRLAKRTGTVVVLVGHVTKEGGIAGPKVLEHMIDCFLMLEGGASDRFRTLRGHKNRFGATGELGVFAMTDRGLREVSNPSSIFLSRSDTPSPGSVVTVLWEGSRPLLVEIQALVDESHGNYARRVAVGLDGQRLAMQLAVLHRHGGLSVGDQDVFANVVGGVRVQETGADLALQLAVASSFRNRALPLGLLVFGEVGLSGEVRPVPNGQERLREAAKHGFTHAVIPVGNKPRSAPEGLRVHAIERLAQGLALELE